MDYGRILESTALATVLVLDTITTLFFSLSVDDSVLLYAPIDFCLFVQKRSLTARTGVTQPQFGFSDEDEFQAC